MLKIIINLNVYDNNTLPLYSCSHLADIVIKPNVVDGTSLISYACLSETTECDPLGSLVHSLNVTNRVVKT